MKVAAIVLACVVGMAWGQGRAITNSFGGGGAGGFNAFNTITNPLDRTCGPHKDVCYGQGLNTVGALPANPFIAQCMARVAKQYNYILRINRDGTMIVTDRYGQPFEEQAEFEAAGPHLSFQQQSQLRQQAFNIERMTLELEFCGGQQ